jgi:hypothetical protein
MDDILFMEMGLNIPNLTKKNGCPENRGNHFRNYGHHLFGNGISCFVCVDR